MGRGREIEVALYKGDTFLGIGTYKELAKKFNKTVESIKYLGTPAYKKRHSSGKNYLEIVKLD